MIGRTNTGGGGSGGGSELVIVGGTTRPAKAAQNTIWLNTVVEITSYVLSASEPGTPVEGMAWVTIGDTGRIVATSPIGGNWITVYPLSAKQYISGAWKSVEAKSYQNGEWNYWIYYLYIEGNQCDSITGGWNAYTEGNTSFVQYEEDQIHEYADNKGVAAASCKTNVPIGNNTVLKVEMSWTAIGNHTLLLRWDGDGGTMYGSTTITSGSPASEISGSGVYSLSINRDGRANIALFSQANNAKLRAYVKRVWLE